MAQGTCRQLRKTVGGMMKKTIAIIVLCMALGAGALLLGAMAMKQEYRAELISEMNKRELHYDADDWFVLIDRKTGLCGVYKACAPIEHTFLDEVPAAGLYKACELNIAWDVPEWTPVLVRD